MQSLKSEPLAFEGLHENWTLALRFQVYRTIWRQFPRVCSDAPAGFAQAGETYGCVPMGKMIFEELLM